MIIEKIAVENLKAAEYNPRKALKPGDAEYENLKRSIMEFGYVEPVIWNKQTGNVVGGHQRLTVMRDLGITEIDCVVVDLDPTREKALNVALNKISGEWDVPLLTSLLKDLEDSGFDATLTGFDVSEMSDLFDDQSDIVEDDPPDVAPEGIEPVSKLGDRWILGRHVLYCGDSTDPNDVSRLMGGCMADMVFTDPPWNVNYGDQDEDNPQGYKPRKILNDFMGTEEFKTFMFNAFKCMNNASKDGAMTYVVMSAQEWGNMMLTLAMNNYHWSSTIIWNKDRLVLSRKDYHTKYEPIWYGWKEGAGRLHPLADRKQSDVWDFDRPSKSDIHPTMKPVSLVARAIENSSDKDDVILDLFGGSGTTMIACEQTNRSCYMMELDPKYADVIVKRWEEFTGKKAVLDDTKRNIL